METKEIKIKVKDIINGYINNDEEGVVGYGGKLNIRPPYQREFVYSTKDEQAVINTIIAGLPLNIMYWVESPDGTYELLDGQQRTMSICNFFQDDFSVDYKYSFNYKATYPEIYEQMLNYELTIYVCTGTDKEKLDWFKTINIGQKVLTTQELRNSIYTGTWLTEAKKFFSKRGGPAYCIGANYMTGAVERQDYLETVLKWIDPTGSPENYMSIHQNDDNADEIINYFKDVIDWVKTLFPIYNKEMKKVPWGLLYNKYHMNIYDPEELKKEVIALMEDDDVTNKTGIYEYIFDRAEKHLNIRAFLESDKRSVYTKEKGICPICGKPFKYSEAEADHITPWCDGGKTKIENLQVICRDCNRHKSFH